MDALGSNCERGGRNPREKRITQPERARFTVGRASSHTTLLPVSMALWVSNFGAFPYPNGTRDPGLFSYQGEVAVGQGGEVEVDLRPGHAYTLSTLKHARKGNPAGTSPRPAKGSFPDWYEDSFDECAISKIPNYIAPMAGAFKCTPATGRPGHSLRQASPAKAICDRGDVMPFAIVGDADLVIAHMSIYGNNH